MFDSIGNLNTDSNTLDKALLVGRVVFNNDPDKQQRIKVLIPNHLEGDPSSLPWIGPRLHSPFGASRSFGSVNVPIIDSLVIVEFQGGDLNKGIYDGCISSASLAAAMPPELSTNYPNRYGFFDPKGNKFYQDLSSGVTEFIHNSGTKIRFDPNGDLTGTVVGNLNANVTGNVTASVGGNVSATVSGSVNASVAGTVTGSAASWSVTGPATFNSPVLFKAQVTAEAGMSVAGDSSVTTINATGRIRTQTTVESVGNMISQADVIASNKSLVNHVHGGVLPGGASTTAPL